LRPVRDQLYKGCFLVHNSTGTQATRHAGARRRILGSFAGGNLLLQGKDRVALDDDWSIEYCAMHATPINQTAVCLDRSQNLFAIVSADVTLSSELAYVARAQDPAYGCTKFRVEGTGLAHGKDLTGLYLIDNASGEPYYIQYGIDAQGFLGVIYDRRRDLDRSGTFSVTAGYAANLQVNANCVTWSFAGAPHRASVAELEEVGYSANQVPLWGFATAVASTLVRAAVLNAVAAIDLEDGSSFEINVSDAAPFSISAPTGAAAAGTRISVTLRNLAASGVSARWDSLYKLAPWSSPAPGFSRSIDFRFDGHSWIEVARTASDVPN
jgi:hypothetical protein